MKTIYATKSFVSDEDELTYLRYLTRNLIYSLPKCDQCDQPATAAYKRGEGRWCDNHKNGAPDYPRAEPLRKLSEIL